jgi:hypothetical protein
VQLISLSAQTRDRTEQQFALKRRRLQSKAALGIQWNHQKRSEDSRIDTEGAEGVVGDWELRLRSQDETAESKYRRAVQQQQYQQYQPAGPLRLQETRRLLYPHASRTTECFYQRPRPPGPRRRP